MDAPESVQVRPNLEPGYMAILFIILVARAIVIVVRPVVLRFRRVLCFFVKPVPGDVQTLTQTLGFLELEVVNIMGPLLVLHGVEVFLGFVVDVGGVPVGLAQLEDIIVAVGFFGGEIPEEDQSMAFSHSPIDSFTLVEGEGQG